MSLSILSTSKIDLKKNIYIIYQVDFFSFQQRLATEHALQHLKILSQPCTPPASESEIGAAGALRSPPRRLPRSAWETQQLGFFQQLCTKQDQWEFQPYFVGIFHYIGLI